MAINLDGITRKVRKKPATRNPAHHGSPSVRSELRVRVVDQSGKLKQYGLFHENVFVTGGLDRLANLIATGGEASNQWVNAFGIGTNNTAASSTDTGLYGETTIKGIPQVTVSKPAARKVRWSVTFESDEPPGQLTVKEVGLFFTDATNKILIARRDLATNEQVIKSDNDRQFWDWDAEFQPV